MNPLLRLVLGPLDGEFAAPSLVQLGVMVAAAHFPWWLRRRLNRPRSGTRPRRLPGTYDTLIKLVLIGDTCESMLDLATHRAPPRASGLGLRAGAGVSTGVGKTCLLLRFSEDSWIGPANIATIG